MPRSDRMSSNGSPRPAPPAIRAFRTEDARAAADARARATLSQGATTAQAEATTLARALRAERRRKGGPGYDLLRHAGLVRRLRGQLGQPT